MMKPILRLASKLVTDAHVLPRFGFLILHGIEWIMLTV